jgi:transglutaminase-like putative cysteine protease
MREYLNPTDIIDSDNPAIKEKAAELIKGQTDIIEKARALFYFVRDEIKYNIYVDKYLAEHFRASNILAKGEGYCVQKAALLSALARAVGIPAGVGFAKLRNNLLPEKTLKWLGTDILPFHGYSELYINRNWVKATPAVDLRTCERGRIVPVEFDGKNDALLNSRNHDGALHIEYLKFRGRYPDIPLNILWDTVTRYYGSKFLEPSRQD